MYDDVVAQHLCFLVREEREKFVLASASVCLANSCELFPLCLVSLFVCILQQPCSGNQKVEICIGIYLKYSISWRYLSLADEEEKTVFGRVMRGQHGMNVVVQACLLCAAPSIQSAAQHEKRKHDE
jgi:hypothetical protein